MALWSWYERPSRIEALLPGADLLVLHRGGILVVDAVCGPAGSLLPTPGATSPDACQPCPAGWFCSRAGLSFPEAACDGGWFCPRASLSGRSPGKCGASSPVACCGTTRGPSWKEACPRAFPLHQAPVTPQQGDGSS